jgi:hypothetical protein
MRLVPLLVYLVTATTWPAFAEQKSSLLDLAKRKFGANNLGPSEIALFVLTEKGETAVADPKNNLVHAECIHWLCTDREASSRVTYRGIDLEKMKIHGDLDLENAQISFPIYAEHCEFDGNIQLVAARIHSIELSDCSAKVVDAADITVEGMMLFQPNFKATSLQLLNATIKGNLECDRATLNNPDKFALNADGARIDGRVFLRSLKAKGELQFLDASVGGNVECDAAQLSAKETALNFDGANIKGSVFIRDKFVAHGEVNFLGAFVGGNVECDEATMSAGEVALNFDGTTIKGSVYLRNNFTSQGEVNLLNATIGGTLDCRKAMFKNQGNIALNADATRVDGSVFLEDSKTEGQLRFILATVGEDVECDGAEISATGLAVDFDATSIKGDLYLRNKFISHGEVNLRAATIGGALDCNSAHFDNPNAIALDGYKLHVERGIYFGEGSLAEGEVNFWEATVGGTIYCNNSSFIRTGLSSDPSKTGPSPVSHMALYLNAARIAGSVYLQNGFNTQGEVSFGDAVISGNFVVGDAQFNNPAGNALYAENIKVEGNVYFQRDHPTNINGRVSFFGANIANDFMWWDVRLTPSSQVDLSYAKVAMLEDNESSWPQPGNLFIEGFSYDRIYEESSTSRQRWLALQPVGAHFQPYNHLAAIYRNLERSEDVRDVMIAKNLNYSKFTKPFSLDWLWYNMIGRLIGYGYDPLRPFLLSVVVILVGAFVFHRARKQKIITATKDETSTRARPEPENIPENYPSFNALIYSMESFIPLVKFDQACNWMPNTNRGKDVKFGRLCFTTGSLYRGYLWLHIIAGWVLTSWWVGLVTGITRS